MSSVGSGMLSGLSSRASAVIEKARSIANSVSAVIRSALKINSPSKVTRELGYQTGRGFELGLEDSRRELEGRARELSSTGIAAGSLLPVSSGNIQSKTNAAMESRVEQQLDRIIRRLEEEEQVLKLDGRTFGRLVREYV